MKQKEYLLKSIKIALAALISIAIAGKLELVNSATAGIITILSIQNTKRETLRSAGRRGLAYLCALSLAAVVFGCFGYTLPVFAIYLFLFSLFCLNRGWPETISMASVLVTHFLEAENMSAGMVINESLLFVIGAGIGILVNLHLHRKSEEFGKLAEEVDAQVKGILLRMSRLLMVEDKSGFRPDCFEKLEGYLEAARLCAATNYNNQLWLQDTYELDYVAMRQQQAVVLQGIYESIASIGYHPSQAEQVAELINEIHNQYHKENTAEKLLMQLQELVDRMRKEQLPASREEFEARAILFYILTQLKRLMMIKRDFILKNVGFR